MVIRVYLAGPMTNCNEHQRRAWRKDIKRELKRRGYAVLDPTEDNSRKGAFAVTADVDEADVVIANLWKEATSDKEFFNGIEGFQDSFGLPVIGSLQLHRSVSQAVWKTMSELPRAC
jgi:hypothetical protein